MFDKISMYIYPIIYKQQMAQTYNHTLRHGQPEIPKNSWLLLLMYTIDTLDGQNPESVVTIDVPYQLSQDMFYEHIKHPPVCNSLDIHK